jgi:hypothetical protein
MQAVEARPASGTDHISGPVLVRFEVLRFPRNSSRVLLGRGEILETARGAGTVRFGSAVPGLNAPRLSSDRGMYPSATRTAIQRTTL